MQRKLFSIAVLTLVATSAFAVDWKKHPELERARKHIEESKKELAKADDHKKTEFGGHRAEAIKHLDQAWHEIDEAAKYAESNAQ